MPALEPPHGAAGPPAPRHGPAGRTEGPCGACKESLTTIIDNALKAKGIPREDL